METGVGRFQGYEECRPGARPVARPGQCGDECASEERLSGLCTITANTDARSPRYRMGRVAVPAIVESLEDLYRVQRGEMSADQVRRIEVAEALIDTGATALSMPRQFVQQ